MGLCRRGSRRTLTRRRRCAGVSRSTRDRTSLPQRSLIVVQAALSLVMLVGAGLLTKSLRNMEHQDFGLQTENRYVLHLDPGRRGIYAGDSCLRLYRTAASNSSARCRA